MDNNNNNFQGPNQNSSPQPSDPPSSPLDPDQTINSTLAKQPTILPSEPPVIPEAQNPLEPALSPSQIPTQTEPQPLTPPPLNFETPEAAQQNLNTSPGNFDWSQMYVSGNTSSSQAVSNPTAPLNPVLVDTPYQTPIQPAQPQAKEPFAPSGLEAQYGTPSQSLGGSPTISPPPVDNSYFNQPQVPANPSITDTQTPPTMAASMNSTPPFENQANPFGPPGTVVDTLVQPIPTFPPQSSGFQNTSEETPNFGPNPQAQPASPDLSTQTPISETSEPAPTDLSQLTEAGSMTPMNDVYNPPVSAPETLVIPSETPSATPATLNQSGGRKLPLLAIIAAVIVLLGVAGASAYFILGIGQSTPPVESLPIVEDQSPLTNPPAQESTAPNATSSSNTTPSGSDNPSNGFGTINGSSGASPSATKTPTSALEISKQRQQSGN